MIDFENKHSFESNGESFYVDIGLFGQIASGKSTLLNAIFGDVIAETSIDRTTKTAQQFYESLNTNTNQQVFKSTTAR